MLIIISALVIVVYSLQLSRRRRQSEVRVAKLDPTASSIYIPNGNGSQYAAHHDGPSRLSGAFSAAGDEEEATAAPSADASGITNKSSAALEVFRTENAVILNEVHATPLQQITPAQSKRLRHLELLKRLIETGGAIVLVSLHAAAYILSSGQPGHNGAGASWEACWGIVWLYFAILSGWTLTTPHSLYTHKTLIQITYFIITILNLRTAILTSSSSISPTHPEYTPHDMLVLTIIQAVIGGLTVLPALFFPLKRKLPQSLQAIHRTMKAEPKHSLARTALPTPNLRAARRKRALASRDVVEEGDEDAEEGSLPESPVDEELAEDARLALFKAAEDAADTSEAPLKRGKDEPISPELYASLYSRLLFGFVTPELTTHFRSQYKLEEVPHLMPDDEAAAVVSAFRARSGDAGRLSGAEEKKKSKGKNKKRGLKDDPVEALVAGTTAAFKTSLPKRLFIHFWPQLLYQFSTSLMQAILSLSAPLGLQFILQFIAERGRRQQPDMPRSGPDSEGLPVHMAVLYAVLMLIGQVLYSIFASQALMMGRKICINLRAILITEIMTKALRRRDRGGTRKDETKEEGEEDGAGKKAAEKPAEEERATDGQVVNLISVDVFKVAEVCAYLHFVLPMSPIQIGLSLFFLARLLGWSAILGFGGLLISMPFQAYVSAFYLRLQKQLLEVTDERLNLSTEVLNCIKTVKCESIGSCC